MDCETATPLIEALCDDELDVATVARLVAHLDGCAGCAALWRDAETRMSAFREARTVDRLPDDVRERLVRQVGRSSSPRRSPAWALPAGLAAAVLLAGSLAAGLALRKGAAPGAPALPDVPVVREVTGEVFCLRCALKRLFPGTPVLDERHLPVLRTEDGDVITLLDGAVTEAVLAQKGCAGRRVALTLRLYPRQDLAEVLSVRAAAPDDAGAPPRAGVAAIARVAAPTR